LIIPGYGLSTSLGDNFDKTIFGRDTLAMVRSAIQLLRWKGCPPELRALALEVVRLGLISLASYQAEEPQAENPLHDAIVGGIIHEHSVSELNGELVSEKRREINRLYGPKWGGDETGFTYWGSWDATPEFVDVLEEAVSVLGRDFLNTEFVHRLNGGTRTLFQTLMGCMNWLDQILTTSALGQIDTRRTCPGGHTFPVWRDSQESGYVHPETGRLANFNRPIAFFEVQAKAQHAYLAARRMLNGEVDESQLKRWLGHAEIIQRQAFSLFWMEDEQYFAQAVDRDEVTDLPRKVRAITTTPAETLRYSLYSALPEEDYRTYVGGIVRKHWGQDSMTDIGSRATGLSAATYLPTPTYHGYLMVWEYPNNDIQMGEREQGFGPLAEDHEVRGMNGHNVEGRALEYNVVLPDGRVVYDPHMDERSDAHEGDTAITDLPTRFQGWTVFGIARKVADLSQPTPPPATEWHRQIIREIQEEFPLVSLISTQAELDAAWDRGAKVRLDTELGQAQLKAWYNAQGVDPSQTDPDPRIYRML